MGDIGCVNTLAKAITFRGMQAKDAALPNIEDVAAAAGVSTATVSRVLNNPDAVREALRTRVIEAVTRLGYVPHAGARALKLQRSGTVGAIFPTIDNAIFAKAIDALQQRLADDSFDESLAVDVELQPGQMSMHDVFMIHGAKPNRSPRRRAGVALRYMPATSVFERDLDPVEGRSGVPVAFAKRPLWLLRGSDRSGRNDFRIGFEKP